MFWKGLIKLFLTTSIINGYVIDSELHLPKNIPDTKVNLNFQHPEVRGGLFEGDIALSDSKLAEGKLAWDFEKFPLKKWANKKVPYRISGLYSDYDIATINVAIKTLNRMSCLQFKPQESEEDFLFIWPVKYPKGCWSFIGKQGGMQILSLDGSDTYGDNCLSAEGI